MHILIGKISLSKHTLWIHFEPKEEISYLEINATVEWGLKDNAKFLYHFPLLESEDFNCKEFDLLRSADKNVGYFSYLHNKLKDNHLNLTIKIPPGTKGIGFRTWDAENVILINFLKLYSSELNLSWNYEQEFRIEDKSYLKNKIAINLGIEKYSCPERCFISHARWFASMDNQQISIKRLNRKKIYFKMKGEELVPIVNYSEPLAILNIPNDISIYLKLIGDKSRNMLKKAKSLGYYYATKDPSAHLTDIRDIRISDTMRQGRPIPSYFYNIPIELISKDDSACLHHGMRFFGIYHSDTLVAYCTLITSGEIAWINDFFVHKSHKNNGISNILFFSMVNQLIEENSSIKCINYHYILGNSSIDIFKRSVGFRARNIITYDSSMKIDSYSDLSDKAEQVLMIKAKESRGKLSRNDLEFDFLNQEIESSHSIFQIFNDPTIELHLFHSEHDLNSFIYGRMINNFESFEIGRIFAFSFPGILSDISDIDFRERMKKRFSDGESIFLDVRKGFKGSRFATLAYLKCIEVVDSIFNTFVVLKRVI